MEGSEEPQHCCNLGRSMLTPFRATGGATVVFLPQPAKAIKAAPNNRMQFTERRVLPVRLAARLLSKMLTEQSLLSNALRANSNRGRMAAPMCRQPVERHSVSWRCRAICELRRGHRKRRIHRHCYERLRGNR